MPGHSHTSSISETTIHLRADSTRNDDGEQQDARPITIRLNTDEVANLRYYSSRLRRNLQRVENSTLILSPEPTKKVTQESLNILIEILRKGRWVLPESEWSDFLKPPDKLHGLCCAIKAYNVRVGLDVFEPASGKLRDTLADICKKGTDRSCPLLSKFCSFSTWSYPHDWMPIARVLGWDNIALQSYMGCLWGSTKHFGDIDDVETFDREIITRNRKSIFTRTFKATFAWMHEYCFPLERDTFKQELIRKLNKAFNLDDVTKDVTKRAAAEESLRGTHTPAKFLAVFTTVVTGVRGSGNSGYAQAGSSSSSTLPLRPQKKTTIWNQKRPSNRRQSAEDPWQEAKASFITWMEAFLAEELDRMTKEFEQFHREEDLESQQDNAPESQQGDLVESFEDEENNTSMHSHQEDVSNAEETGIASEGISM